MRIQKINSQQNFGITLCERDILKVIQTGVTTLPNLGASESDISREIGRAHFTRLVNSSPLFRQMSEKAGPFFFNPLNLFKD